MGIRRKSFLFLVLICSFVLVAKNASAEDWLSSWSYRKAITISNTNVSSDLSNFPLLVQITDEADIGANISNESDGYDIRFTGADGTTVLPYEKSSFSVSGGLAAGIFWVKVPTISSADSTTIYIYYGNASANTDWTADTSLADDCASITNAQCVWKEGASQSYLGVWHLEETGGNPTATDSSASGNNSATQTWTPTTSGKIGSAGSFNGSSNSININSNSALNPTDITVSAWVKADVNNKWQHAVVKNGQWNFGRDNNGKYYLAAWNTAGDIAADEHASQSATIDAWEYITYTYDGSRAKYYLGTTAVIDKAVSGDLRSLDNAVNIGSQSGSGNYWDGLIDDVKISNVARPADWITFEYHNQSDEGNNLTFGSQATEPILVSSISVYGAGTATSVVNSSTLQMNADVLPGNVTNPAVTWSVTNETGSATIDASGLLTAVGTGTVTVTATAADGSGITGTRQITITSTAQISAQPAHPIGGSVSSRVANLEAMGLAQEAEKIKKQWPHLFEPQTRVVTSVNSNLSKLNRDLTLKSKGEDVKTLQKFLIDTNAGPKALELKQIGATGYFGEYTRSALAEFQKSSSIEPAIGYFGQITRTFINREQN